MRTVSFSTGWMLLALLAAAVLDVSSPAAAATDAEIKQAIERGANYLRSVAQQQGGGMRSLVAYTLLKCGDPPDSPFISQVIDEIGAKVQNGVYRDAGGQPAIYTAGINLMLLADSGVGRQKKDVFRAVCQYLIDQQQEEGAWSYTKETPHDTSVTQYAVLGLWAAQRGGLKVPQDVWVRVARWHIDTQRSGGGFMYRPGLARVQRQNDVTLSMTGAAIGSLAVAKMHLHPSTFRDQLKATAAANRSVEPRAKRYGILVPVPPPSEEPVEPLLPDDPPPAQVSLSAKEIDAVLNMGMAWMNANYQVKNDIPDYPFYYYYTLERMGALTGQTTLKGRDWFDECSTYLVERQTPKGDWREPGTQMWSNCFALLFLTQSTGKLLGNYRRPDLIGGGLLAGGRGLPDDLTRLDPTDGELKVRKLDTPLDQLLAGLASATATDLEQVQTEFVKNVQITDRRELIGKQDQLIELLDHPSGDVRRTALWALGRTGEVSLARHAIRALDDPDLDVIIEARHALCWIARRPNGFGEPADPLANIPDDADFEVRQQAIARWLDRVKYEWGKWYLKHIPYDEQFNALSSELRRHVDDYERRQRSGRM